MAVKVLILEDNPVARSFLCRVVRESFSDAIAITEAGDLESARREIGLTGGPRGLERPAPMDHERLTPRENEVLTYLSKGFTIKEIAALMGIKWFTVNDHIKSIYKKLNVSSRAEAAVLASKQGLV